MEFMIAPKRGLGLCPFTATFNRGGRPAAPIHYAVAGSIQRICYTPSGPDLGWAFLPKDDLSGSAASTYAGEALYLPRHQLRIVVVLTSSPR